MQTVLLVTVVCRPLASSTPRSSPCVAANIQRGSNDYTGPTCCQAGSICIVSDVHGTLNACVSLLAACMTDVCACHHNPCVALMGWNPVMVVYVYNLRTECISALRVVLDVTRSKRLGGESVRCSVVDYIVCKLYCACAGMCVDGLMVGVREPVWCVPECADRETLVCGKCEPGGTECLVPCSGGAPKI